VVVLSCFCFALTTCFIGVPQYRFWSFDHIERHARGRIAASELQSWALVLARRYPNGTNLWPSRMGTNFPAPLLRLYHAPPSIMVYEATTNWPTYVSLMWGGGVIGHCGFEIGPTNFVCYRKNARAWQPGVYFWSEYPQK